MFPYGLSEYLDTQRLVFAHLFYLSACCHRFDTSRVNREVTCDEPHLLDEFVLSIVKTKIALKRFQLE